MDVRQDTRLDNSTLGSCPFSSLPLQGCEGTAAGFLFSSVSSMEVHSLEILLPNAWIFQIFLHFVPLPLLRFYNFRYCCRICDSNMEI